MSLEKIEIQKIYTETGYLYNYCEKIFLLKNYLEDKLFKDFPDRMVFETSIWMIGSFIEQEIRKNKKILNNLLFEEVKKIIQTKKYLTGRQGFVMLLHYFKKNIPTSIWFSSIPNRATPTAGANAAIRSFSPKSGLSFFIIEWLKLLFQWLSGGKSIK